MNKKKIVIGLLILLLPTYAFAEVIKLDKKDYLTLVVGSYVHGFKEFDTSIISSESSVRIGIYYDISTQSANRANQLALRFRDQVPEMLKRYKWAKEVKILVNVYSEDRTGRGY